MKGERPRKIVPPSAGMRQSWNPRWPAGRRRPRSVRVPDTLVEQTVRTAVLVARRDSAASTQLMPKRVRRLVRDALGAMAGNKWHLIRLVLIVIGAALVAAGWLAHQLVGAQDSLIR